VVAVMAMMLPPSPGQRDPDHDRAPPATFHSLA